jgi:hypothetical protein
VFSKTMKLNVITLVALVSLAGCASREITTDYWTQKSGVVTVHHVKGREDVTERLVAKPLADSDVKNAGLPTKGKYYQISQGRETITSPSPTPTPSTSKGSSSKEYAAVKSQISDLQHQIKAVREENQRLQAELDAKPEPQESPSADGQAQADQTSVRLSQ